MQDVEIKKILTLKVEPNLFSYYVKTDQEDQGGTDHFYSWLQFETLSRKYWATSSKSISDEFLNDTKKK